MKLSLTRRDDSLDRLGAANRPKTRLCAFLFITLGKLMTFAFLPSEKGNPQQSST